MHNELKTVEDLASSTDEDGKLLTLGQSALVSSETLLGKTESTLIQIVLEQLEHTLLVRSKASNLTDDITSELGGLTRLSLEGDGARAHRALLDLVALASTTSNTTISQQQRIEREREKS